jgi:hypothetical protein
VMIDVGTDNEKLLDNPQCKFLELLKFFYVMTRGSK